MKRRYVSSPGFQSAQSSSPEAEWPKRVKMVTDLCIVDDNNFFILGNLDIPIIGHEETVRWSVWSSLSEKSFNRACDVWETEGRENEPPYFGWLNSQIPGYDRTANLALQVHTQEVGVRPHFVVMAADHRLFQEQSQGISWERACELSTLAMAGE